MIFETQVDLTRKMVQLLDKGFRSAATSILRLLLDDSRYLKDV